MSATEDDAGMPALIRRYLEAANRLDAEAAGDCFAMDALVHDEEQDHHGRGAVRQWLDATMAKYQPRYKVLKCVEGKGRWHLELQVSGTFPGSPIELDFIFTTREGLISRLEIG